MTWASLATVALRVLFVGNSLTTANDLPRQVQQIAAAAGCRLEYRVVALGGFSLEDHWNDGAARRAIAEGGWSFVVLQQGPSALPESRVLLVEYARRFAADARRVGAEPALYMVWPSQTRRGDVEGVRQSYEAAAQSTHALLLPAGEAWRAAMRADAGVGLYGPDGFHPTAAGSFLAALVIFERMFGLPPPAAFRPPMIPERERRILLEAAERVRGFVVAVATLASRRIAIVVFRAIAVDPRWHIRCPLTAYPVVHGYARCEHVEGTGGRDRRRARSRDCTVVPVGRPGRRGGDCARAGRGGGRRAGHSGDQAGGARKRNPQPDGAGRRAPGGQREAAAGARRGRRAPPPAGARDAAHGIGSGRAGRRNLRRARQPAARAERGDRRAKRNQHRAHGRRCVRIALLAGRALRRRTARPGRVEKPRVRSAAAAQDRPVARSGLGAREGGGGMGDRVQRIGGRAHASRHRERPGALLDRAAARREGPRDGAAVRGERAGPRVGGRGSRRRQDRRD